MKDLYKAVLQSKADESRENRRSYRYCIESAILSVLHRIGDKDSTRYRFRKSQEIRMQYGKIPIEIGAEKEMYSVTGRIVIECGAAFSVFGTENEKLSSTTGKFVMNSAPQLKTKN